MRRVGRRTGTPQVLPFPLRFPPISPQPILSPDPNLLLSPLIGSGRSIPALSCPIFLYLFATSYRPGVRLTVSEFQCYTFF